MNRSARQAKELGLLTSGTYGQHFFHLIRQCRPITVFGEQVASKDGLAWIDLVQSDLEGEGYTCGAVDTCAAGFGAPHIRQRLYWVGKDSIGNRRGGWNNGNTSRIDRKIQTSGLCTTGGMANTLCQQEYEEQQRPSQNEGSRGTSQSSGCGLVNPSLVTSPIDGHWRDADWIFCRDGKWRATQSVTEQMADGIAHRLGYSRFGNRYSLNPLQEKAENRVGRLRGYGNAIVAQQAKCFIESFMKK